MIRGALGSRAVLDLPKSYIRIIPHPVSSETQKKEKATAKRSLKQLIIKELGYKARSEKPGLMGRASIAWQSGVDRDEAEACGRTAVRAAVSGETAKMVALRRVSERPYRAETFLADIREVMMTERKMPDEFINAEGNGVTEAFKAWCRPLLGGPLPRLIDLRGESSHAEYQHP